MAIGVLVEALLRGGGGAISGGGEPPPKDEKGLKEWIRNKLKALASLLEKLSIKAAKSLPGIIGGIISWILNRAKDKRCSWLGITKSIGFGCRFWRINLYLYGNQKIIVLRFVI